MPYRDSWATCGQCGKQFIFRIEEQRRLGAQGQEVVPPDVCPVCRGVARTQPGPRPAADAAGRGPATSTSRLRVLPR